MKDPYLSKQVQAGNILTACIGRACVVVYDQDVYKNFIKMSRSTFIIQGPSPTVVCRHLPTLLETYIASGIREV